MLTKGNKNIFDLIRFKRLIPISFINYFQLLQCLVRATTNFYVRFQILQCVNKLTIILYKPTKKSSLQNK